MYSRSFRLIFVLIAYQAQVMSNQSLSGEEDIEAGRLKRSARPKKCPGCSIDHKDHRWGMPHKDCKGPSFGSEKMSLVDFPASEAVGVKHVIKPDFGGDLPRNLDIPEFEFDEYGVSRPTGLNPPVDELSDCDNDEA